MESKDKVKLLRKFTDLIVLAELNGLTASMSYASCTQSISYYLRKKPEDDYLIFVNIWVDQITYEEGEKRFLELLSKTNEIYTENKLAGV